MDDRNDDFYNNSFFGGDFDKHFRDVLRDMDDMFKRMGDFQIDFRPPPVSLGSKVPGLNQSARDMMLKQDNSSDEQNAQQGQGISTAQPRFFHPGFRQPFERDDAGPLGSDSNFRFQMSGQSTSIRHNPDGSMEKIVKRMENGQTCTTVTETDKEGVTTTTTNCDRPGDLASVRDRPPGFFRPPQVPALPSRHGDDLNEDDKTIFKRYFSDWFRPKDR